jgi:hypothetical protein
MRRRMLNWKETPSVLKVQLEERGSAELTACSCADHEASAVRCACGNLLARRVAAGIELKCRRCKRVLVLSLEGEERSD